MHHFDDHLDEKKLEKLKEEVRLAVLEAMDEVLGKYYGKEAHPKDANLPIFLKAVDVVTEDCLRRAYVSFPDDGVKSTAYAHVLLK